MAECEYKDAVEITGVVLAADVKNGRFTIYPNPEDPSGVEVTSYPPEYETTITEALKEHHTRRLRVRGRGEFGPPAGKLRGITKVDEVTPLSNEEPPFDPNERPIWEKIIEIANQIPDEEMAKIPPDASVNLDHYLYGAPKR